MKKEKLFNYTLPDVECVVIRSASCIADSFRMDDGLPKYDETKPGDWEFYD